MTNYNILLPPSEGKIEGGKEKYIEAKSGHAFGFLEKDRIFLLKNLLDFISKANHSDLDKLFSVKSNISNITSFLENFDQKLTLPAIERYSGVMFSAIDYPSLDDAQKDRANNSILFIDALFGLLRLQDLIPNYKLAISAKFSDFKIDHHWKKVLKNHLEEALKDKIILDILPQAHRKAVDISSQDSTSGPEWQLLHEVRREDKNVKERKEERQDPQEPDILNTFMYAGREEVQMEGEDGVKAHNVIGGEKKIDRSKKARTKQN